MLRKPAWVFWEGARKPSASILDAKYSHQILRLYCARLGRGRGERGLVKCSEEEWVRREVWCFLEQLARLTLRESEKMITKYYHFSDSRASSLASRWGLVELRTMRCWLKHSQTFSSFVTPLCCLYVQYTYVARLCSLPYYLLNQAFYPMIPFIRGLDEKNPSPVWIFGEKRRRRNYVIQNFFSLSFKTTAPSYPPT